MDSITGCDTSSAVRSISSNGPSLKAHLVFQDAVDGGEVGHAFAHHAQGLGAVAAPGVVDDEAGRVLRGHGGVAELAGEGGQPLAHRCAGLQSGDHLHHLHQRHRVEEVKARQLGGPLERRGNRRDRQRRGVGGQHRVGPDDAFEFGEQALLDVEPLDDRLDHQIARCEVAQGIGQPEPVHAGLHLLDRHLVLGDQRLPGGLQCITRGERCTGLDIEQPDLAACLGRHLGDSAAHGAGSHDACVLKDGLHKRVVFGMKPVGAMTESPNERKKEVWRAQVLDRLYFAINCLEQLRRDPWSAQRCGRDR